MSNELAADYGVTGKTVYFLLRSPTGQIWNGAAFENYNAAHEATYPITATEQGASGFYVGNMPAAAFGTYLATAKVQAGGSPAEGDLTVSSQGVDWDGAAVFSLPGLLLGGANGQWEGVAAKLSLLTAVLKLTSAFDAKLGVVYKSDGVTAKITQAITNDPTMVPIRRLGVGS